MNILKLTTIMTIHTLTKSASLSFISSCTHNYTISFLKLMLLFPSTSYCEQSNLVLVNGSKLIMVTTKRDCTTQGEIIAT